MSDGTMGGGHIAATLEIVIERFQERDTPIAIDPSASPEASEAEEVAVDESVDEPAGAQSL